MDNPRLARLPPELLEMIILALPLKDALRIDVLCRELEAVVKASPRLQQALFFKPKDGLLQQNWVNQGGADAGTDCKLLSLLSLLNGLKLWYRNANTICSIRLQYSTTATTSTAASPPCANPFLPTYTPPPMVQDPRNVGHRIEYDMVASLLENASLKYMFVSQPPTTSLQLWGRVGARGDGQPTGMTIGVAEGVRVGHVMHAMEKFGEGAFVMIVGSGDWAR